MFYGILGTEEIIHPSVLFLVFKEQRYLDLIKKKKEKKEESNVSVAGAKRISISNAATATQH